MAAKKDQAWHRQKMPMTRDKNVNKGGSSPTAGTAGD
jgi:hypothetical protein